MNKYKRIFLVVMDSVGIGEAPDAEQLISSFENFFNCNENEISSITVACVII